MYVEVRFYRLDGTEVHEIRMVEFPADAVVPLVQEWLKYLEGKSLSWTSKLWKSGGVQKMLIAMETLEYADAIEAGVISEKEGR